MYACLFCIVFRQTCLGKWNRLFLRNMFLAWLQVPSMMITLRFIVPTSWYCTNSSRFWDLGPGYRISVLLSRHTAANSGFLRGDRKKAKYIWQFSHYGVADVVKSVYQPEKLLTFPHWISFQLSRCIFLVANKQRVEEPCEVLCSPESALEVRIVDHNHELVKAFFVWF